MTTNSTGYMRDYMRSRRAHKVHKNSFRSDETDYIYMDMLKSKPRLFKRYKVQQEFDKGVY